MHRINYFHLIFPGFPDKIIVIPSLYLIPSFLSLPVIIKRITQIAIQRKSTEGHLPVTSLKDELIWITSSPDNHHAKRIGDVVDGNKAVIR